MRLFVSVDLPAEMADAVAAVQDEFRGASGLRFTDPAQAHLTLKFLGEVPEDDGDEDGDGDCDGVEDGDGDDEPEVEAVQRELERAVEDAGVEPFEATFGGLGVFPNLDYISVLWLGVESGGEELTRLHEAVEDRMVEMGFEPESHEFTPHVTLARMDHAGGKELVQEGVRESDPTVGSFEVTEVRLTESTLTADGPAYSTVHRVGL